MKKRYIYALTALFSLGVVGCNKPTDFGDANTNPAQVNTKLLNALLTNSCLAITGYSSNGTLSINGAQYSQYISETQYSGTSLYNLPQIDFTGYYTGVLFDLQSIIDDKNATKNQIAVSKILQQYTFWAVTDSWGDVPYSEALKGINGIKPKYDDQKDIYAGILSTLATAAGELDNSAIPGDIIFNGDASAWKKAANSLIMLVSLQESKKYPTAAGPAATAFKNAMAGGYISTNADNMKLKYPGGNYKSRWWSVYDGRKDYGESKTMTDKLGSLGDGRINPFGGESDQAGNVATSSVGVPYGLKRDNVIKFTDANTNWARILRGDLRKEDGTVNIVTAAEVTLAIAEASKLGWVTTDPTAYNRGITLSFEQWGVTLPAGYLTSGGVVLTNGANDIEKISTQRWIASYPNGHMGWDIYRKSGFPVLTPAPDAVGAFVNRFVYATSESTTNTVNYKAAVAKIPGGKDVQEAKVWWATDGAAQ
ncbi:SusD/RagB family nutrient-binding outer membrane lipoprotein [Mucilaginibacter conchicola]|uniref:SusD/RagB family nutrient-binding outer membrane lipoprotein n=1 Tax=Mucilaginibacter conchicola TaxID=2303333 RepID=A0A372NTQ6_9SPHI|nr:SusD/RagB family nutrient-binding outer membrane lipoprotein [Mucilaginibacter conchicola]RFZ92626.1 SusD/RagB family nutrient-binding outer membrane lipoprotein [Mucilaginibacter conchicola]